jgi:large subunit ribosomal protein L1
MGKTGKKYTEAKNKIDRTKRYTLEEALQLLPETSYVRFDESIDVAIRLGVDPKKPDQMVRGTVVLPHGTGKEVRVVVFAQGEKEKEAREAGTDYVGGEELVEKIAKGWLDFDKAIATPDMMKVVSSCPTPR